MLWGRLLALSTHNSQIPLLAPFTYNIHSTHFPTDYLQNILAKMTTREKKVKKVEELKACVRKLPPNLTQEVFTKSLANFKDTLTNFYYVQGQNK